MNDKEKNQTKNLFVYGTLQQGQSRNYVLQGLSYEKATLLNFRKVSPPSLGFPFIIKDENSEVKGEIYFNLSDSLFSQIDLIEGEGVLYHRINVKVQIFDGEEYEAYTYYPDKQLIERYV
ncbi:MAG: gamma-glutamylcyclotransferase [Candidatus Lokiarchaeota archaeon]|nr:gamma-glutamylcyclotransferase [Candidatus Lokiarchaeota archaeon]MBD3338470.1 gamma-glutamylcyclotransferase [Candidatus Lokiarchaeota archaeon]